MTDHLAKAIRQYSDHCIFLSPHLDDAVFSAGDLITALGAESVHCSVFTFFTDATSYTPTLSARAFLHQSMSPTAEALFAARRDEDARLLSGRGIQHRHFGLIDAMWRQFDHQSPLQKIIGPVLSEFVHVYPTYRWHVASGKIHPDDPAVTQVASILQKLKSEFPTSLFFGPIATGTHVDHCVVQQAILSSGFPCVFWNDYPYSLRAKPDASLLHRHRLREVTFLASWEKQREFILEYQTQVMAIFRDGVPESGSESFFIPPSLDSLIG